jgi:hypothetical protein
VRIDGIQRLEAYLLFQGIEEPHFTLTEHEDAPRLQVLVEPGQRKTGFLDVRTGNDAVQAAGAAQDFERQPRRLRPAVQKPADGDSRGAHLVVRPDCTAPGHDRPRSAVSRAATTERPATIVE